MEYIIRRRTKEDCKDIARVVTIAWNETYKGIVPDEFLENLKNNEEERAQHTIETYDTDKKIVLVLEVDNEVVGFANCGITDDEEFTACGEIFALYIIAKYKGNGFGKKLVEAAIKELKALGCNKMLIGCLEGNPSNEFYKHIGGKYIKKGMFVKLQIPENIYYYDI